MKRGMLLGLIGMIGVGIMSAAQGATTKENLQTAYQGESKAKTRYETFAAKADAEGYKSVSALFRAAAKSEAIHAGKHAAMLKKMGEKAVAVAEKPVVKSTKENLEDALKADSLEKSTLYPEFVKQAESEKMAGTAMSFKGAIASEGAIAGLIKKALSEVESWKAEGKEFGVCLVCGYVMMGPVPEKCPICAAPKEKFVMFK